MKGKDCMRSTYTYEELAAAYDNFLAPAVAVYLNKGKDNIVQTKGIAIDRVQVTLSVEGSASMQLQVIDVFDGESTSIKKDVRDSFAVGTVIEVAMGYGSDLTSVFFGYVTEARTSYQDSPVMTVTGVDLRKLLMKNKREHYAYAGKSYTGMFQEVLSNYKTLYKELHVDELKGENILFQNDTDYQFIEKELCYRANRNFFVVGGNVYFIEPESETAFLQLDWGKGLTSFQREDNYYNQTLKLYSGQEDKTGVAVSGRIRTGTDTPSLTREELIEEYQAGEEIDAATLQNYLNQLIGERESGMTSVSGSLPGLPEIVPGRYLKVGGVDNADGGSFYIRQVSHSFGSDGFTTTFRSGQNKDRLTEGAKKTTGTALPQAANRISRAIVKQNWDKKYPGKVAVEFLTGEKGKKTTDWLPVLHPYCGDGYGFYFLPEIGTEVAVGSLSGDSNSLVVIGGLWNQVDQLPEKTAGEKNDIKRIRTKGEHEIVFDDGESSPGIYITTKQKLHISLLDKDKSILISDENGKNGVTIQTEDGNVKLFAENSITLAAGGKDAIVIDGGSSVTICSDKIEEKGNRSLSLKTQSLEVKGNTAELKASGSMKINSSGMTEIKGTMVKIN